MATPEEEFEEEESEDDQNADDAWRRSDPLSSISSDSSQAALEEAGRRMAQTLLASPRNDDPMDANAIDLMGFEDDAKAFARLVASTDVKPPLAIAIFGSWGSGKSFFMRLIQEHVQRLSDGKVDRKAPEATSGNFHTEIAQIRFNAWHYSETNLWASLVDHLFTQLGNFVKPKDAVGQPGPEEPATARGRSILDNLSTTRTLTIESAERLEAQRKTQTALTDKLAQAEADRNKWEREVMARPTTYLDVVQAVISSDSGVEGGLAGAEAKLKEQIAEAAHMLGVDAVEGEAQRIAEELREADTLSGEARAAFNSVAKVAGSKLRAAMLFASIPLGLLLLWIAARIAQALNVPDVFALVAQVGTSLLLVGESIRRLNKLATPVVAKMKAVKKAVDEKLAAGIAEHRKNIDANRDALRQAEARVAAAKQDLAASAASLVSAVEDFHGSTGTGRLLKFLRTRAQDGHYAKHLGLVASVRRDFEELSLGMQSSGKRVELPLEELAALRARLSALTSASSALLPEDRKILEELEKSISRISVENSQLKPPFSRLVLYIDDLDRCPHEKVIEVLQAVHMLMAFPLFTVFVAVDVRWLIQALASEYAGMLAPIDEPSGRHRAAPHDYLEKIFQLPYWIEEVNEKSGARLLKALLPADDDDDDLLGSPAPNGSDDENLSGHEFTAPLTVRSLTFTRDHRTLVGLFLPFFVTSPRKLLWFVNAFRLLKATSLPLSQQDEEQHDFMIILQLALASISRKEFHRWLASLEGLDIPTSLVTFFDGCDGVRRSPLFWDAAYKAADVAEARGLAVFDPQMLRHYGRRAHRFCFTFPETLKKPLLQIEADEEADRLANEMADG
ncbi:P-loop NTPase fold protein [Roseateles sp. SL47]|uniref:P-loop NTPase fold protein n=1 Tax=Roseateles sp. SL47 TaxID=2995138 RepID=UPI00226EEC6F|nr:P-loop NTPase fold protein [Roseateles sp. SL47]WAC73531.1 P-loop NTPase fold protein [Roseateles sp. SL47]